MLRVNEIDVFYGDLQALRKASIEVNPGEVVSVIGSNGAGKSTLLRSISGILRARRGKIVFNEKEISQTPTYRIVEHGISHVPEGRQIFPNMTVLENLQLGAELTEGDHFEDDLGRVYDLFPILKERAQQRGGTLSGGEQQMLAVARALMGRPKLLLLDEPSLGLAPMIVKQIFSVIGDLNRKEGLTVFLVEQNAFHALRLAHRGYVMVNGQITMSGTGKSLLAKKEIRAAYLEGGR